MIRTKGRCNACKKIFMWVSGKKSMEIALSDAYCPECGGKLVQTGRLISGPAPATFRWSNKRPVMVGEAVSIREEINNERRRSL